MNVVKVPAVRWFGDPVPLPGWNGFRLEREGAPTLFAARGPENGPPLLLFPGVCDPWHTFETVFDRLAPHTTLWCVDLRGHGWSDRDSAGRYGVADYLDDALTLADALLPERFAVGGNSLGALIAAGVAASRPDRVSHVVLEDGPFLITEPDVWEGKRLRTRVFADIAERLRKREAESLTTAQFAALYRERSFAFMPDGDLATRLRWAGKLMAQMDNLRGSLDPTGQARMDAAVVALVSGGEATWGELFPDFVIDGIAAKYAHVDWRVPAATASTAFSQGFDHVAALSAITAPTLVLEADRDLSGLLNTDEMTRMLSALGQRGHHLLVEGAMHEIHETHPALYADAVARLMAGSLKTWLWCSPERDSQPRRKIRRFRRRPA